jgi:hypothetical protein
MRRPYRPTAIYLATAIIDCLYEVSGMWDGETIEEMESYLFDMHKVYNDSVSCYR